MADEPKPTGALSLPTLLRSSESEPGSSETRLRPAAEPVDPATLPLVTVDLDHYEVGAEVARGGLGRILRAQDRRLNRPVAVKVLRVRDARAEKRFLREALITAKLQHPAIVPIYDAGRWPDGEPFYAMKLLSGKSLAELIDERKTLEGRLAFLHNVIAVVDAIAYAHDKRVIHRDLKPANIMVGEFGETLVIDWGLAKELDEASDAGTPQPPTPNVYSGDTVAGSVLGTPAYMAPEQALGEAADERADVYALGGVLYHLLRGAMPFSGLSAQEAMQRLRIGAPPDIVKVVRGVPEDLAAIVRKAMAPKREDRYPSARELAADLRRFETGQLVSVREYAWWQVLWREVLRHRAAVAVGALALVALATIGAVSVQRVVEERNAAQRERNAADAARAQADRRGDQMVLVQASTALDRDPTAALAWLKQHPGGEALTSLRTVASDALARGIASHVLRRHEGRVTGLAFGADAAHLFSAGSDGTLLGEDLKAGKTRELVAPPGILWVLARAPSGKTIAVTGTGGFVRIISDDLPERRLELGGGNPLALEFSPDGRFLAAGTVSGEVWLWNVDTGERRDLKGHTAEVRDLAFSRDGARLASASFDGTVQLTALATGESKLLRLGTEEVWSVDFGLDGVLAAASDDGLVRLFDKTGAKVAELSGHKGPIVDLSFSPDGRLLATASRDHTVRVWAAPFKDARVLEGHSSDVLKAVFAPDGRTLASVSTDRTVRLWDLASTDVRVLLGHEGSVSHVAFAPDSSAVATAGLDGSVRVWKVAGAGERIARGFTKAVVSPRGTSLAGMQADGKLSVVDAQGQVHAISGAGWRWFGFTDEEHLAGVDGNREVVLWDAAAQTTRTLDRIPVDVGSAVLASGWLALSAWDGTLRLRRLSDGAGRVWKGHKTYTLVVDASPDGTLIASGGDEGDVKLWNVATGDSRTLAGDKNPVHSVRFSPDGTLLATGDINGEVRIWDVAKGAVLLEQKDRSFVRAVAFSSDGALLVSGGDDKKVRVRDVKSGQTLALLEGPEQPVFDLAFSPDSSLVAAGSADQTVRVFEWKKTGAARVLRGHRATVSRVLFSADGATLTSVDEAGSVRRWTREELAPLPADRAELAKWMDAQTTVQIDAEHRASSVAP